jgi:hypothetical protein
LADKDAFGFPIIRYFPGGYKLRLQPTLVFVAPNHQIKEVWNEGGRDVVLGAMFSPARINRTLQYVIDWGTLRIILNGEACKVSIFQYKMYKNNSITKLNSVVLL